MVLAGDHEQLPPIIQGEYPPPAPGEPLLHSSVFDLLRGALPSGTPVIRQLLENRRMNDVLTRFAATLLYGPRYHCATATVRDRRLPFSAPAGLDPLLACCLSPAHPLVLVLLQGVQATDVNPVEAALVARLTAALRSHLRDDRDKPYADDATFFRDGGFVCPHRAQNRAVRLAIRAELQRDARPFVDTVDKTQGQQADAVLVSYGVADPEYALNEADFIYNRNRLNVAITRARSKCVVCLPQPLLDASPRVLEQPGAAEGLGYMRRLVRMVEVEGESQTFDLGEGIRARVCESTTEKGQPMNESTELSYEVSLLGTLNEKLRNLKGLRTLVSELIQNADDAKGIDDADRALRKWGFWWRRRSWRIAQ